MPTPTTIDIATKVLAKARIMDYRMRLGSTEDESAAQIMAWAECFDGQPIWPQEALDAVAQHYRNKNAFPLMPGDVLDHCRRQPVWSSAEHVSAWLDWAVEHPWTPALEEYVGRPVLPMRPDSYSIDDKPRLVEQRRAFVAQHRQALIEAILGTRATPKALEA